MPTYRLLFSALLLGATMGALPVNTNAANKPKSGVSLLGSHPDATSRDARQALLKQRSGAVTRSNPRPGKTIQSLNRHPGKTLGNTSVSK